MARAYDAHYLLGRVGNLVHAAHGKVNLVHIFRSGEVAGDAKGNQDRLVLNLRYAKVGHALLEDADDGEGNATDLEVLADRCIHAAEAIAGKELGDNGAFNMSRVVGLVQKAAHRHHQVADLLVLRTHAQHQRVLVDAAAEVDAVVHGQNGRGVEHAGQLRQHGLLVVAGEVVVVEYALRRG